MDLLGSGARTGYLLKSRVTDVDDFVETLERIVKGASVVDPALKHVHSILQKLRLPETGDDRRRVLAVVAYLDVR